MLGDIGSRPGLLARDRSLVTRVALISLGKVAELRVHVPVALRPGLTREEIDEVIGQLSLYLGYPAAVEARKKAREILEELDEQEAAQTGSA
ncbi:MAG: carboxymuconolactone decarboxylase family protein [Deltaproteobacteria bacterium]|nr:carboxymuconolactone decarboxylase family protein [Deltaproteobacteria bacterium]MBW2419443.1 carboxymuconolactone decarboxylase family protein [Deltaproteobacteria bacterium]